MTFFTLYHGINPPLKTTNLGEYVLELFPSIKHSQIQGLQNKGKELNLCFRKWIEIRDGFIIKYIQTTTKLQICLFDFVSIPGGPRSAMTTKNVQYLYLYHPSTLKKSSPWRARVARAPKAQAVAMGDLLGNLLKIHQGLWMFMI